jgi:hypothetical protein
MRKMKYHDVQQVTSQPEIVIKEVIREVIKEVPVYQTPQIITKEVIKEVQSPNLLEEINRLTKQLADRDKLIHQINFEKIELTSKLNVSEMSIKEDVTSLHNEIKTLIAENQRLAIDLGVNKELKNMFTYELDEVREENSKLRVDYARSCEENIKLKNQVDNLKCDNSALIKLVETNIRNEEDKFQTVINKLVTANTNFEQNELTDLFDKKIKMAKEIKEETVMQLNTTPTPREDMYAFNLQSLDELVHSNMLNETNLSGEDQLSIVDSITENTCLKFW